MADDAAKLYQAFVSQDPAAAIGVIEKVKRSGTEQGALFDSLFAPAMSLLGGAWASGAIDEYTFTQASVIAEQITSFVTPPATAQDTGITVIVGAMHRDYHAIDKNIVGAALKEAGHRVIDLGVDVRPAEYLERIEETGTRIVIVCASMNATANEVARVREILTTAGLQDVVILVSGGPFEADPELARQVGANGVVRGAESALKLVERIARDRQKAGA
ncbi:MAG: cobalamin-dependent protein [Actinobacteria bacterium]|nr:cobalamin-dependent protein [Actinomycetota bacterium]MCG2807650.1 cobalamin-dependent protein [Coriobacteriia bacterium]MDP2232883.1 cobalamin-dependent protein [Actinomycetota bacterium]